VKQLGLDMYPDGIPGRKGHIPGETWVEPGLTRGVTGGWYPLNDVKTTKFPQFVNDIDVCCQDMSVHVGLPVIKGGGRFSGHADVRASSDTGQACPGH